MNSIKILSFIIVAAITFGCNKKLDIKPQNTITPDQIISAEDVRAVLFGAYSTMQNANAFGEMYNTIPELLYTV